LDISFTFSDTRKAHPHNNQKVGSSFTAWFTWGCLQPYKYGGSLIQGPAVAIMDATIKAVLARAATLVKENGGGQLHKLSYAEGNISASWL
jgi:hypothetical protein